MRTSRKPFSQEFFPISRFAESELRSAVAGISTILDEDKHAGSSRERTPARAIPENPTPQEAGNSLANLDLLAAVVAAHRHLPDTKPSPSPQSEAVDLISMDTRTFGTRPEHHKVVATYSYATVD